MAAITYCADRSQLGRLCGQQLALSVTSSKPVDSSSKPVDSSSKPVETGSVLLADPCEGGCISLGELTGSIA